MAVDQPDDRDKHLAVVEKLYALTMRNELAWKKDDGAVAAYCAHYGTTELKLYMAGPRGSPQQAHLWLTPNEGQLIWIRGDKDDRISALLRDAWQTVKRRDDRTDETLDDFLSG